VLDRYGFDLRRYVKYKGNNPQELYHASYTKKQTN
jgi:predicted DNA-binding ArsR family transcriptional regulator